VSFCLQPFHVFSAILVEYIRKQQEMVIEYVQLENQVLREQIGGKRVLLNDDQRRLLAVKGKSVGRNLLEKTATIAQAETILRWHRELIEPNRDFQANQNAIGRPPVDQEIEDLVVRLASENESWGYKRIEGALDNLGFAICSSTVAKILKKHGIEPAPCRQPPRSASG
jgi:putative transposase